MATMQQRIYTALPHMKHNELTSVKFTAKSVQTLLTHASNFSLLQLLEPIWSNILIYAYYASLIPGIQDIHRTKKS